MSLCSSPCFRDTNWSSAFLCFVVVWSLSCDRLLVTPMDCSTPGSSVLQYVPEFAQAPVHWVDDAIHSLILCCPLLLLLSIFPSIRVFCNESTLHIRWPKYWSFSVSISPSSEQSALLIYMLTLFLSLIFLSLPFFIQEAYCSSSPCSDSWSSGKPETYFNVPSSLIYWLWASRLHSHFLFLVPTPHSDLCHLHFCPSHPRESVSPLGLRVLSTSLWHIFTDTGYIARYTVGVQRPDGAVK